MKSHLNSCRTLAHLKLEQKDCYEIQHRQKAIDHLKAVLMLDPLLPVRTETERIPFLFRKGR